MARQSSLGKFATAFVTLSMLASSAASAAPRTIDPLVALSVFGTAESRAAVCAAGSQAAAAAGAAVAAQAAQPGCVLPVVDTPPPAVVTEVPPPPPPIVESAGLGILPLLLGLVAIAAAAALILGGNDGDGRVRLPVSPAA